jgi:SAM-dependent methyltransferase
MHLLKKKIVTERWFYSDLLFNSIYPFSIQQLASRHWSPLRVARKAAGFLTVEDGVRVLDIGSGVGKFCLAAAFYKPRAFYYGVEQRRILSQHAEQAKAILGFQNVAFVHGNFTELNLSSYDHFYFYNSFFENLAGADKIDDSIAYSYGLYNYYSCYLYKQLEKMPAGTRLATFHSLENEIPASYRVTGFEIDSLLKFWIKV